MADLFDIDDIDELGGIFPTGTVGATGSGAATGFMIGGPKGAAIGAVAGFALGLASDRQRRKAAERAAQAKRQAQEEGRQARNQLVEESFRRRSRASGSGSIGQLSPGQEGASRQGTSLLAPSASSTPSLFEGTK